MSLSESLRQGCLEVIRDRALAAGCLEALDQAPADSHTQAGRDGSRDMGTLTGTNGGAHETIVGRSVTVTKTRKVFSTTCRRTLTEMETNGAVACLAVAHEDKLGTMDTDMSPKEVGPHDEVPATAVAADVQAGLEGGFFSIISFLTPTFFYIFSNDFVFHMFVFETQRFSKTHLHRIFFGLLNLEAIPT